MALAALLVAAFAARVLLARQVLAPWEMGDELLYAETSRSFLSAGHYLFREQPIALRTIYPALIAPAWLADSTQTAYTLIKAINVALMTLGAIPVYLWARRLVSPPWALLPVVFYLAMPGFMYSAEVLTENAFLPTTMLALFAIAVVLERPTLLRQALALAAIALACAARLQGVVFLLVLPTAVGLSLLLDAIAAAPGARRGVAREKLRRFWPSLATLFGGVVLYVAYEVARGTSLWRGAGVYQQVSSTHYSVRPAVRWTAYHFGELVFSVGLIPVSALILLFGLACRRATSPNAPERAFLSVAVAAVFWVVVQIGTFASQFSLRIEERYMFGLAPVLFLALAVWLARGLPRPPSLTSVAVLVPTVFLLVLPYQSFFNTSLFNDTYGLIPLWRLTTRLGANAGDVPVLLAIGALVAGLLVAVVPSWWARIAVPAAVCCFLLLSSASVFATVTWLSRATRYAGGLVGDPSWIDHKVGENARVELVYTADIADPHVAWQAQFWNRSVRRILGVTSQDPGRPDLSATVGRGGLILSALRPGSPDYSPRYAVAAKGVGIAGKPIASGGQLVLWRTSGPLRMRSLTVGLTPDGWTGPSTTFVRYSGVRHVRRAVVNLALFGFPNLPTAHVSAAIGPIGAAPWTTRTVTVPVGKNRRLELPVRRHSPFQVVLSVSPTFSPSQYGSPDTRTLGVHAAFSVR